MFHAPTGRTRLATRRLVGDENSVTSNGLGKDKLGTTATAKLIKAAAATGAATKKNHTLLKSKALTGAKSIGARPGTALATKALNAKRSASGDGNGGATVGLGFKANGSIAPKPSMIRPSKARSASAEPPSVTAASTIPTAHTYSTRLRMARGSGPGTNHHTINGRLGVMRSRSASATNTRPGPTVRPGLRSKGSAASLSHSRSLRVVRGQRSTDSMVVTDLITPAAITDSSTGCSDEAGSVDEDSVVSTTSTQSHPKPMARHDSQTTVVGDAELTTTEHEDAAMDLDDKVNKDHCGVHLSKHTHLDGDEDDHCRRLAMDDQSDTASVQTVTEANSALEIEGAKAEDKTSLEFIMAHFQEDIDPYDTTMVPEYCNDIFTYLRQLEVRMLPSPTYMDKQHELEWNMRSILVDWLVQVHWRFCLLPETLFLCVNYIDRFLSHKAVSLEKLQLVGATALLIAAKFEEIHVPSISDFVYMVDNAYTCDEIMKAERFMISLLGFDLAFPGPMSFLRRISKADDYDIQTRTLAKYLIEVTIMDQRFLPFTASKVAAAGHFLARRLLNKGSWTDAHVYYSEYTEAMLQDVLKVLIDLLGNYKSHRAIYDKYSDRKFMKASLFVRQWLATNPAESLLTSAPAPQDARS
ncbi:B-type cyclin [Dimargaris verticillata]|uniref:B-type cyclin n=1 Tax=Dimargaris verticillata TaxID=2761393 RepID=A0A9W8B3U0_9FUNG|nr:B-type cyclin [Dimargaris verticillata]